MAKTSKHTYVVILCGGGGTRLWPLSRRQTPKQFISLLDKHTLYETTLSRIKGMVPIDHIYVITNQAYYHTVRKLSPQIPPQNIISEPVKKNTALAMGVASVFIHHRDPQAVVINLASDQLVANTPLFQETMLAAAQIAASKKHFVTVGITPTFPHTGLGYIQAGQVVTQVDGFPVLKAEGFTEKPAFDVAQKYLATGKYFWNANLYTWSTQLVLQEFSRHAPHIYKHLLAIQKFLDTPQQQQVFNDHYQQCPEEQIDTAISEKTDKLLVIPGNFGWTDIGSWNVVHDEAPKDVKNNALIRRSAQADWLMIDTENSLVNVGNKTVATIGVDNLMIVDTPDALLIARKDRAQDVKKIVQILTKLKKDDLL